MEETTQEATLWWEAAEEQYQQAVQNGFIGTKEEYFAVRDYT